MKKWNWSLIVDVLILLVVLLMLWQNRPVEAQLAGSSGFNYTHITTATNTQVKSAGGTLHNITVNTPAGTATIVDTSAANCTGGTTVAITGTLATIGQTISYDIQTNNGICIITSGTADLTISSR